MLLGSREITSIPICTLFIKQLLGQISSMGKGHIQVSWTGLNLGWKIKCWIEWWDTFVILHSQKLTTHWNFEVTAQKVPYWLGRLYISLNIAPSKSSKMDNCDWDDDIQWSELFFILFFWECMNILAVCCLPEGIMYKRLKSGRTVYSLPQKKVYTFVKPSTQNWGGPDEN